MDLQTKYNLVPLTLLAGATMCMLAWIYQKHKLRTQCSAGTKFEPLVDEVIKNLPSILLSIVLAYAEPLIQRSAAQKQHVELCCLDDDGKRLYVVLGADEWRMHGMEVQCVNTEDWQMVAMAHSYVPILAGAIFRGRLHVSVYSPRETWGAILDISHVSHVSEIEETDVYEIPEINEEGYIINLLTYKKNDVLIGIRSDGRVQHLHLDCKHHLMSARKSALFAPLSFILDATVNEDASEIYLVTHPKEDIDEEFDPNRRAPGLDVIQVMDADSLVRKRFISCTPSCDFIRGLSYSHLTRSLFVVLVLSNNGAQRKPRSRIEIMQIDLVHDRTCLFCEDLASIDCHALLTVDQPAHPCAIVFDALTLTFVRMHIPQ